ncbi:uncharacterized protein LOC131857505 [Cryptomeria japonica]|uniref:uncharacterized protein LOC131857505 n=1 Tax=Cryptomeria japonica TaxID=3369 RepID=UPI0027DA583C|nr:uncharacterized protein LOC131857505 [Cryptomeria japonica]
MTRTPINIDATTNVEFDNISRLFSTNENAHNCNKKMLYTLKHPVARSLATKVGSVHQAKDFSNDELDLEILISNNSRVMLTSNIWIQARLVNGALGYVRKIIYKPGSSPPEPPSYVMIEFDNYTGIPFEDHHPNIIPITPIQRGGDILVTIEIGMGIEYT